LLEAKGVVDPLISPDPGGEDAVVLYVRFIVDEYPEKPE
jgi:hypothetical protein